MKLEDAALASAGQGRFDVADERTVAPRRLRGSALSKPVPAQKRRPGPRRWALYAGVPIVLGVVGVSVGMRLQRDPPAGKLIVTPSPSVPADLIVDGRPSGQLPPFVRNLPAGKHHIEVRAEGFKPFSTSVNVGTGVEPLEVIARLVSDRPLQLDGVVLAPPPPVEKPRRPAIPVATSTPVAPAKVGYLVVKSRPAARLTIDGRDSNRWTPIPAANPIVLPAGPHTLVLESADGQRLEEQVVIEAGKTAALNRTFP